ncbi:putative NADH-flavin reductase [Microcella putealis]|uniref:Putative NADH-flavin reductase n=1 Tax=Microcella putealis TaxID=337005 RepID=A0A4V2EW82_9MICO|nr:SDR family oxidoreductase [Microcella putealis]RZS55080.1 putative NADH-flavin reductase [Microcella putealis]TQM19616.1 putative NADH-flavin reductase [Microcella putealis]
MKIAIAGGHGQIARKLSSLLSTNGHEPWALIRNADHTADVESDGARAIIVDLERDDDARVAEAVTGADAVVFAAGAGPNSGAERKLTLDRDGAILLADAAVQAGIRRYVIVSSRGADSFDPNSDDVFQIYLRAKSEADAAVRGNENLDWTVVRPGGLTDEPGTGAVRVGADESGTISRDDVAAVLYSLLTTGGGVGAQFEVVNGDAPIAEAVVGL